MAQGAIIGQQPEIPQTYDIGDIKVSTKSNLGEDWVLCQGQKFDENEYPLVKEEIYDTWNIFETNRDGIADYYGVNGYNPHCWLIDGDYLYCAYNLKDDSIRDTNTYIKRTKIPSDLSKFENVYKLPTGSFNKMQFKKVGEYFCLLGEEDSHYYGCILVSKDGKNWKLHNNGGRGFPVNVCYINGKYYLAYYDDYNYRNFLYCVNDFESTPFTSEAEIRNVQFKNTQQFDIGVVNDYLIVSTGKELYSAKNPTQSSSFTKFTTNFTDDDVIRLFQPFVQMPNGALYYFTNKKIYKVRENSLTLESDKISVYEDINANNGYPNITPYSIVPFNENIIIYARTDENISNSFYYYYLYNIKDKTIKYFHNYGSTLAGGSGYNFTGVFANERIGTCCNYTYNHYPHFYYFPITFPKPLSPNTNTFIKVK